MKLATRLAAIVAIFAIGCGGEPPPSYTPDQGLAPRVPDSRVVSYQLTMFGTPTISLQPGQQIRLAAQLRGEAEFASGEAVTFALLGYAGNSTLSTFTAVTNLNGVAETTLTAGDSAMIFQVEAQSPRAPTAVTWNVTITANTPPPPPPPPVQTPLSGTFKLTSTINATADFKGGTIGSVFNLLEDITDDPQDPGKFLVDLIVDELRDSVSNSVFKTIVNLFANALYNEVNRYVAGSSMTQDIMGISRDLSSLARRFTLVSTLTLNPTIEGSADGVHKLDGINWAINGRTTSHTYTQLGLKAPSVADISVSLSGGTLTISKHELDLHFGAFLLAGLNTMVIPQYDPRARRITDLMGRWIDCNSLGNQLDATTSYLLGPALWQSACNSALVASGATIEKQITEMGSGKSKLEIKGQVRISDTNNDGLYDQMLNGAWIGDLELDGAKSPLGPGNVFSGTR